MAERFITQNRIVGFKEEATAGTFTEPQAVDYDIILYDVTYPEIDYHVNRPGNPARGNLTQSQSITGMRSATFNGNAELQYSGDPLVAPKIVKLLKACGLQVTEDGVNPVTIEYKGIASCDTLSAIVTDLNCGTSPDAISQKVAGIQGNVVVKADGVGQQIMLEFSFTGKDAGEIDNASPVLAITGVDTGARERFLGTVFTIGAQAYKINSFNIDLGNTVSVIPDPADAAGIITTQITATDAKMTAQIQKIDIATSNLPQNIIDNVVFSSIKLAGTHWDIEIKDGNIVSKKNADADGIVAEDLEIEIRNLVMTQK